ncbi:MAG: nucleotidyl transferase AbiEii/AbiGii toxin family protein [Propionibacteriaceae bacterium]|jgi:hypothetical protein|nr:nucleotidyl transferase AbiEii/AbiGii toxin family protein [Propionibacteriaceae bacterium]
MASDAIPVLAAKLAGLKPKTKVPASAQVLSSWISMVERDIEGDTAGRLSWLVASTVATAVLQRAVSEDGQSRFLLKGGTMLQHRLAVQTRATKDVDGLVRGDIDSFIADLDAIFAEPWGVIGFRRSEVEIIDTPAKVIKPRRFQLLLTLRGVTWRRVQIELSPDEGHAGETGELFPAPVLAGFGLPQPEALLGLAMRYQIAQKLHAASDPHDPPDYLNDRARDIVDLLLLKALSEESGSPTLAGIRQAGLDIFEARAKEARALGRSVRSWPPTMTAHEHWGDDYADAARSGGLATTLEDAVDVVNEWITQIDQAVSE